MHFVDNEQLNTTDRFCKVEPLIEILNSTFKSAYELGAHISFDEATIKATGRRVPGKLFNPMKPHKWGMKLFMTCCGETGYCYKFEVYKGKHNGSEAMCTGPAALLRNMKEFAYSKRIVYCDRFYTSVAVFIQLLYLGLYACGTIMVNRKGFSEYLKMEKSSDRGTLRQATATIGDAGVMSGIAWKDTKVVHLISTGIKTNASTVTRRGKKGMKLVINSSNVVKQYTKYMNGVDHHDQLRMARYSVQACNIHKKWYKLFFLAMVDLCLVNSFIIWKRIKGNLENSLKDHAWFQEQVCLGLLNIKIGSIKTRSFSPYDNIKQSSSSFHDSICSHSIVRYDIGDGYAGREKRYRRCFVCNLNGVRSMSEFYCKECQVCICTKVNSNGRLCWLELHSSKDLHNKLDKRNYRLTNASEKTREKQNPNERTPRSKRSRKRQCNSDKKQKIADTMLV